MRSEHHLFWLEPDGEVSCFGAPYSEQIAQSFKRKKLSELCLSHPKLKIALELHFRKCGPKTRKYSPAQTEALNQTILQVRAGQPAKRADKLRLLYSALDIGSSELLDVVLTHWADFEGLATPQYRQLLPRISKPKETRDQLIFHSAKPNLYLWVPKKTAQPKTLLVCFTTSSNTLNAPLPLAHSKLSDLGIAILYVYTPPGQHPSAGAARKWDVERTSRLILKIAETQGFTELFGLGTSLGGYSVCRYAHALDFVRVVNFSGSAGKVDPPRTELTDPMRWVGDYDLSRILSVLSRNDETDQTILERYNKHEFITDRVMLQSDRHGSFTASWVEGRLDEILGWLMLGGAVPASLDEIPAQRRTVGVLPDPLSHAPVSNESMPYLQIIGDQTIRGYRYGFSQPCLLVKTLLTDPQHMGYHLAERLCGAVVPSLPDTHVVKVDRQRQTPEAALLQVVIELTSAIQDSVGLPVLNPGQVFPLPDGASLGTDGSKHSSTWLLALPSFSLPASKLALEEVLRVLRLLAEDPSLTVLPKGETEAFELVLDKIADLAPRGTNPHQFMRAALKKDVPIMSLPGGALLLGQGSKSRVFKSSLSDMTSAIGTAWAKNKQQTNQILKMAGLRVAEQTAVGSIEEVLRAARKIGFPVVVKPADLDQGIGVEAGLKNETELRSAFQRASSHGRLVLLEEHIDGQDIRVNVLGGKFHTATLREPAGITGDGMSSVLTLISEANKDPRRSKRRFAMMRPIELTDEARELLQEQNLTEKSVPQMGHFVRLRRAANLSGGGVPTDVTADFHPDNALLCEEAAKSLRLDIAGVDLLISDYKRSWRDVGGAVCEVNAQPQMGPTHLHIYEDIVTSSIKGEARIPVIGVLLDDPKGLQKIKTDLGLDHKVSGLRVFIDPSLEPEAFFVNQAVSVRAAIMDTDCKALIIVTTGQSFKSAGLPVDRVNMLWVAGWTGLAKDTVGRVHAMLPHLTRPVIAVADDASLQTLRQALPERVQLVPMDSEAFGQRVQALWRSDVSKAKSKSAPRLAG